MLAIEFELDRVENRAEKVRVSRGCGSTDRRPTSEFCAVLIRHRANPVPASTDSITRGPGQRERWQREAAWRARAGRTIQMTRTHF